MFIIYVSFIILITKVIVIGFIAFITLVIFIILVICITSIMNITNIMIIICGMLRKVLCYFQVHKFVLFWWQMYKKSLYKSCGMWYIIAKNK